MACNKVKCTNCTTVLPACQMIQGMCPTCYTNKNKTNSSTNVPNQPVINAGQFNR